MARPPIGHREEVRAECASRLLQVLRDEILSRRDEIGAPSADRKHWDDTLRAIFTDYTLVNWTDFNYGKCYTYEILMPRGSTASPGSFEEEQQLLRALGGSRASLLLKLSVIVPYYLLCVVVRDLDAHDESVRERYVQPRDAEERDLWARAVGFAGQHGFSAIDLESLSAPISEIEMELAEPGTVMVYNCLFEDQSNLAPLPYAAPAADDGHHPEGRLSSSTPS